MLSGTGESNPRDTCMQGANTPTSFLANGELLHRAAPLPPSPQHRGSTHGANTWCQEGYQDLRGTANTRISITLVKPGEKKKRKRRKIGEN